MTVDELCPKSDVIRLKCLHSGGSLDIANIVKEKERDLLFHW